MACSSTLERASEDRGLYDTSSSVSSGRDLLLKCPGCGHISWSWEQQSPAPCVIMLGSLILPNWLAAPEGCNACGWPVHGNGWKRDCRLSERRLRHSSRRSMCSLGHAWSTEPKSCTKGGFLCNCCYIGCYNFTACRDAPNKLLSIELGMC